MRLFTVGHSTHDIGTFAGLLRQHGVARLVDVRRHPGSRQVPQFNAGEVARALADQDIEYVHMEELGGRRRAEPESPNGGWRSDQFRGYADHMASEEFGDALERLEALAHERPLAVMCAEAQWWRCHRRLLSDLLVARGAEVLHIDSRGSTQPHELTDFAVVDRGHVTYPPAQAALDV